MARQHHPRHARGRDASALHRRAVDHRADLEPDDLRQGDQRAATPTTSRSSSFTSGAWSRSRRSSSWRWPTSATRRDLFEPVNERTDGVDGWVSLEVSPLLADDAKATIAQVAELHSRADGQRLHQDPRHRRGTRGDRGVDLRGHPDQRHAALLDRAVPRRRRGVHARRRAPDRGRARPRRSLGGVDLRQPLGRGGRRSRFRRSCATASGIAVGKHAYRAYRELLDSERWQRLANEGARPQRLLFASTGTKDPEASDALYVEALAAPFTDRHDARQDPARVRRPRTGRRADPGRRRRRRGGAGRVRGRGRRRRRARRPASARGRGGLRQIVERALAVDRSEEPQSSRPPGEAGRAVPSAAGPGKGAWQCNSE